MKARVIAVSPEVRRSSPYQPAEDETRVAFDACAALIRPDTSGDGVRVILDLHDDQFRDLLAVMVAEHRRRDGSE